MNRRRSCLSRVIVAAIAVQALALTRATGQTPPGSADCSPPTCTPLASPLTIARTQSTLAADTLAPGNQLTITYTVFNSRNEPVSEPVLVTTMAAGVTLIAADPTPDQPAPPDGRLAFVLPAVPAFGRASATLTVSLSAGALQGDPVVVDDGARVFGNVRTRQVGATVAPTALRPTLGEDGDLLRSTIDANSGDQYVLQALGQVGCDPPALFAFVRDDIRFEAYRGSLRGARGTLWSRAGNALDRASLLIAMLRACGVPSRYVSGTLADATAQQLIASMFEPAAAVVGGLATDSEPPAAGAADPVHLAQLLDEVRQHYWVQYRSSPTTFVDLDPSLPTASVGQTLTAAEQSFAEVDDALRHHVTLHLDSELLPGGLNAVFTDVAAALCGPPPLACPPFVHVGAATTVQTTVLAKTFSTVELVGEPISIGHFVDQSGSFTNYSPWLRVGAGDIVRGTDYQEGSSFLAAEILTGLFVRLTTQDPTGFQNTTERAIFDRIGSASRLTGAGFMLSGGSGPPVTNGDIVTVNVSVGRVVPDPGAQDASELADLMHQVDAIVAAGSDPAAPAAMAVEVETAVRLTRLLTDTFLFASDAADATTEQAFLSRLYWDSPRIVISSFRAAQSPAIDLDLRLDSPRVVVSPGQDVTAAMGMRTTKGMMDADLESGIVSRLTGVTPISSVEAFNAPNRDLLTIGPDSVDQLATAAVSASARAEVTQAVSLGRLVVLPVVPGATRAAWFELEPVTGELTAVVEGGGHQALIDYTGVMAVISPEINAGAGTVIGLLHGFSVGILTFVADLLADPFAPMAELKEKAAKDAESNVSALKKFLKGCSLLNGPQLGFLGGCLDFTLEEFELVHISIGEFRAKALAFHAEFKTNVVSQFCSEYECGFDAGMKLAENYLKQELDPPLTALLEDPSPQAATVAGPRASASVAVPASLSPSTSALSGTVGAGYWRTDPGASGSTVAGYPQATFGIAAGSAPAVPGLGFAPMLTVAPGIATLNLDASSGSLTFGGAALDTPAGIGVTGFTGTLVASDAGPVDTVQLSGGQALHVVAVTADPAAPGTTPAVGVTVALRVNTDVADTFDYLAEAPPGWRVQTEADGRFTFTPPDGTTGTFECRLRAQAEHVAGLAADTPVLITVAPPQNLGTVGVHVVPDPLFSVPDEGTFVDFAFLVQVDNRTGGDDTFDVAVSGLGSGDFTQAAPAVVVTDGQTGTVGVAIHPAAGLLPPGTLVQFTVQAIGRTSGITGIDAVSFPYPQVVGVVPSLHPAEIAAAPGTTLAATLTLTAASNVATTFTLSTVDTGIDVSGLPPSVNMQPGDTLTVPLMLSVPADTPLDTTIPLTVVADLCGGLPAGSCDVPQPSERFAALGVLVSAPEAICILDAASTAFQAGSDDLGAALKEFGDALSRLAGAPGDGILQDRAILTGQGLALLLQHEGRTDAADALAMMLTEIASGDPARIAAAAAAACTSLGAFATELADEAAHGFALALVPGAVEMQAGQPVQLVLRLENAGSQTTTINLAVGPLPSGVTATPSVTQVQLAPGEVRDAGSPSPVTLALAASLTSAVFPLVVTGTAAEAPSVTARASAYVAVRPAAADVVSLTLTPSVVLPGDTVGAQARILNSANAARAVVAQLDVLDGTGAVVSSPAAVPLDLVPSTGFVDVDLGTFSTTGLPTGLDTVRVRLLASDGTVLPGRAAAAPLYVGSPVTAAVSVDPVIVLPGTSAATTTIAVTSVASSGTGGPPPPQLMLTGTIRDVKRGDRPGGHPDFETFLGSVKGLVLAQLGPDRTPILANPASGNGGIHSADSFFSWYHDVDGVNLKTPLTVTAVRSGNIYTFNNSAFFPIDNQLWGNEGLPHNYHFTYELHSQFTYQTGQTFSFTGDDDVWVFINDRLAIDLGGVHGAINGSVNLDTLGLTPGVDYPIDLFFAERHTVASDFRFDTGIVLTQPLPALDVTITHRLPVGDYVVDPASITPAPQSSAPDQIVWIGHRAFNDPATITFQATGTVPDIAPGEVRDVSLGTDLSVVITQGNGTQLTQDLQLPPVTVAAAHIVSLSPVAQTVAAGAQTTFDVELRNPLATPVSFTLATVGLEDLVVGLAATASVPAGGTATVPLAVMAPFGSASGDRTFAVVVTTDSGALDTAEGRLTISPAAPLVLDTRGVHLDVFPIQPSAGQGTSALFRVVVTNTGNATDTFALSTALPAGITARFTDPMLTVPAGLTAGRETVLALTPAPGTPPGSVPFTVTTTSTTDGQVMDTRAATLVVTDLGVGVVLSPDHAVLDPSASASFSVTVTNTGDRTDTFDVSLGGPVAPFACIEGATCDPTHTVSLGAGQSQILSIRLSSLNEFLQQTTLLAVQATSQTDATVSALDASRIDFGAFRDLGAALSAAPRGCPGSQHYTLDITNAGNACDERYTLDFSSEPPGVALTAETTTFVVAPLKTARIGIEADVPTGGPFTIQALVQASSDNPLCAAVAALAAPSATATATVAPIVCTALDECHLAGVCDPQSLTCSNPIGPDGSACGGGGPCHGVCQSGVCQSSVLEDADQDGVCDAVDNCLGVPNGSQADGDHDGIGDDCDPCTNLVPVFATKAKLIVKRLDTPPGDDSLGFKGILSAVPTVPTIDPIAKGARVLVNPVDARMPPILDVIIPGGAFDAGTLSGWKSNHARTSFRYFNPAGLHGITKVNIRLNTKKPGLIKFKVLGKNGSFPVLPTDLPLKGTLVIDSPLARTGQCGEALFPGPRPTPSCAFNASGRTVKCK